MPGLMSKSTDLTVFQVNNPAEVTAEKLKQYAFRPIDELKSEEESAGLVSIEDMLDTTWASSVPEKGEWLCFALRVDKRKVPGAVLKKHYAEALKAEQESLAAQGLKFFPKGRKKELKEQLKARLLGTMEPAPSVVEMTVSALMLGWSRACPLPKSSFPWSVTVNLALPGHLRSVASWRSPA